MQRRRQSCRESPPTPRPSSTPRTATRRTNAGARVPGCARDAHRKTRWVELDVEKNARRTENSRFRNSQLGKFKNTETCAIPGFAARAPWENKYLEIDCAELRRVTAVATPHRRSRQLPRRTPTGRAFLGLWRPKKSGRDNNNNKNV